MTQSEIDRQVLKNEAMIKEHTAQLRESNKWEQKKFEQSKNKCEAWVRGNGLAKFTIWKTKGQWAIARRDNLVKAKDTSKNGIRPNYLYDLNSIDPKFLVSK